MPFGKRRPSNTRGASREETNFGPDVLFDQSEVTSPPGRRKPTLKSMGHKLAKSVGLSENFEDEHQTPREVGGVKNRSGLQGVSEHPLLLPDRIPTLESYIEPSQHKVGGTAPQLEKVQ